MEGYSVHSDLDYWADNPAPYLYSPGVEKKLLVASRAPPLFTRHAGGNRPHPIFNLLESTRSPILERIPVECGRKGRKNHKDTKSTKKSLKIFVPFVSLWFSSTEP